MPEPHIKTTSQTNSSRPMLPLSSHFDAVRASAPHVASALYPRTPLKEVVFRFWDGREVPLECAPPAAPTPSERDDTPRLNAMQRKIAKNLRDEGPAPGDVLAPRIGYSSAASLHNKGRHGIREMMEMGLVINDESGYELTEFGQDVLEQMGE